ncbi:MAG: DNA-formamidopyrimidine glycosylase [Dehalococcoidia bacterium]|nr:DNA-formamidopyrimidine glycosylase [Dehalococcoidia bacterium]
MPELPEVETIIRDLKPSVIGQEIKSLKIFDGSNRLFLKNNLSFFHKYLIGQTIRDINRHGKYIIFCLSSLSNFVVHLRMTGSFTILHTNAPVVPYEKLRINFCTNLSMSLIDIRKFATIDISNDANFLVSKLGPDAISRGFNAKFLQSKFIKRNSSVKSALLDQKIAAGVGNIYADEACWAANINPLSRASLLNLDQIELLCKSIKLVLRESISNRGTTINNYKDVLGNSGYHQTRVAVYGRLDKPCFKCKTKISKIKVVGRATYFCPKCQKN